MSLRRRLASPTELVPRRALAGLGGALVLLTLAVTAVLAAGVPASHADSTPGASGTAAATASDRSVGATVEPSEEPSAQTSGKPEDAPTAGSSQATGDDLVAACNALHGNAAAAIDKTVTDRLTEGSTKHNPASSNAPVLPPGLEKVHERLEACQSLLPKATEEPTASPSATASESAEPSEPAEPTPVIVRPTTTPTTHDQPGNSDGHGRGTGRGH